MVAREDILKALLARGIEQGLFLRDVPIDPHADLIEAGQVDSMGLVQLQALVEESFGVVVPVAVFVAELRTIARVAAYLESEIRAGRGRFAAD
ncbi:MAG: phosphopantetheine-binding protein [Polyangiaceae bacterium]